MPEDKQYAVEFVTTSGGRPKLREVAGVDLGASATKAVLVRKTKEGLEVTDARILPPLKPGDGPGKKRLGMPSGWKCRYAALAVSPRRATIRYVTLHGRQDVHARLETELQSHLSIEEDIRVAYRVVPHHRRESETNVLIAGLPEAYAQAVLSLVSAGIPAAASLEISGVVSVGAFMDWGPLGTEEGAVGFLECGASSTVLALFNRRNLCLMRKLPLGGDVLVESIVARMQIDRDTAEKMLQDGSFDISPLVGAMMTDFLQQLKISCEFVERREETRVGRFFLSGGLVLAPYLRGHLESELRRKVVLWNPFQGLGTGGGDWQEGIAGQEPRFSAALGAAVGTLRGEGE